MAGAAALSLGLIRRRRRLAAANMATAATWLCFAPTLALNGGADAPFLLWLVVLPQMAGLLGGAAAGRGLGLPGGGHHRRLSRVKVFLPAA